MIEQIVLAIFRQINLPTFGVKKSKGLKNKIRRMRRKNEKAFFAGNEKSGDGKEGGKRRKARKERKTGGNEVKRRENAKRM